MATRRSWICAFPVKHLGQFSLPETGRQRRGILRASSSARGRRTRWRLPLQRRTYARLHFALWRRLSLRAVSSSQRQRPQAEVHRHLASLAGTERSSHDHGARPAGLLDLQSCWSCSRCPGLAYMEGNMRGPSTADCEKSFQRTGIPTPTCSGGLARARLRGWCRSVR